MTYFLAKWIKGARIVVDSSGVTTFQMLDLFLCFCFNWNKPSMLIKLRRKGKSRGRRPLLPWLLLKAKHCPWAQLERPVKHRRTKSNWTTSILQRPLLLCTEPKLGPSRPTWSYPRTCCPHKDVHSYEPVLTVNIEATLTFILRYYPQYYICLNWRLRRKF